MPAREESVPWRHQGHQGGEEQGGRAEARKVGTEKKKKWESWAHPMHQMVVPGWEEPAIWDMAGRSLPAPRKDLQDHGC